MRHWKCKLLHVWGKGMGAVVWKVALGAWGFRHGKVTSNRGIKEPHQYWGSCASGPHTVIHQIRTFSSTSLYWLDSRSIPVCSGWLWNIGWRCVRYWEFFIRPNALVNLKQRFELTPLLISDEHLNSVGVEGKDKREATLTADPYSDKGGSKGDDHSCDWEIIHRGDIMKI